MPFRQAQKGEQTDIPEPLMRRYLEEDRMADALRSVAMVMLRPHSTKCERWCTSSVWMTERLQNRKAAIIQAEGARIALDLQTKSDQLQSQITSLQISKLNILDMETQMLNRAVKPVRWKIQRDKLDVKSVFVPEKLSGSIKESTGLMRSGIIV